MKRHQNPYFDGWFFLVLGVAGLMLAASWGVFR